MRRILRRIAIALLVLGIGTAGYFGYRWYREVPLEKVTVSGNVHADENEIIRLAALDSVQFIFDATPGVIADRVRRHAWVRQASVTRWPTGVLAIDVVERTPTLLVLDRGGRPAYYVDAEGFAMPFEPDPAFNVPLLHGAREAGHPLRPVANEQVRDLAADLSRVDEAHRALLSDFELRGREVWLRTAATVTGASLEVQLGRSGFEEKFRRLYAFWHQAVLTQPETRFERVDLRFDSQIVTREHADGKRQ